MSAALTDADFAIAAFAGLDARAQWVQQQVERKDASAVERAFISSSPKVPL